MKNYISISEPKVQKIKYWGKLFFYDSVVVLFLKINIIIYFIYMLDKILGKYF